MNTDTQEISSELRDRFKKAFPVYSIGAPTEDALLGYIEGERADAGTKGLMLGSLQERINLAAILETMGGQKGYTWKNMKREMLSYLEKGIEESEQEMV